MSKPRSRKRWGVSACVYTTIAESCRARACALTCKVSFWAAAIVQVKTNRESQSRESGFSMRSERPGVQAQRMDCIRAWGWMEIRGTTPRGSERHLRDVELGK